MGPTLRGLRLVLEGSHLCFHVSLLLLKGSSSVENGVGVCRAPFIQRGLL